jgi:hypothetical protein
LCWKQLAQEPPLLRRPATGEIQEDWVEPGIVHVLYVPTGIEVTGMFLPGDKAAIQVNRSTAGFPQLLSSLPESRQHPLTPRIETEPILEFQPSGEMYSGRKIAIGRPFRNHCINTT